MSNPGKTRQPLRRGNGPLTPSSKKRLTDLTLYIQKQAFNELLDLKGQNAGKLPYGAIRDTVKKYDELGFSGKVTIHNLEYRFNLLSKGETMQCEKELPLVLTTYNSINISELTENSGMGNADIDLTIDRISGTSTSTAKTRGPKRNRIGKRMRDKKNVQEAYHQVCLIYSSEMEKGSRRVAAGTLNQIINNVEFEKGLNPGTLKRNTIIWRLQKKNLTGFNVNKESPLVDIEPVVVDCCTSLAKIGYAQTKNELIGLVQEFIAGTQYEIYLNDFKQARKIESKSLGMAWYIGFMKRNEACLKKNEI